MPILSCAICSGEFHSASHRAKYCSAQCREYGQRYVAGLTCCICGGAMVKSSTSKPQGLAAHNKCRRTTVLTHGEPGYSKGCRCEICRAGKNAAMRQYVAQRTEREGVSPSSQSKRRSRGLDPFAAWDCTVCGEPLLNAARSENPRHKACAGGNKFKISLEARLAIYERDAWTCYLCELPVDRDGDPNGNQAPSLDHVFPKSFGGSDDPSNLKTACRSCNSRKGVSYEPV